MKYSVNERKNCYFPNLNESNKVFECYVLYFFILKRIRAIFGQCFHVIMRNFADFASKFARNLRKFVSDGNPNLTSLK